MTVAFVISVRNHRLIYSKYKDDIDIYKCLIAVNKLKIPV